MKNPSITPHRDSAAELIAENEQNLKANGLDKNLEAIAGMSIYHDIWLRVCDLMDAGAPLEDIIGAVAIGVSGSVQALSFNVARFTNGDEASVRSRLLSRIERLSKIEMRRLDTDVGAPYAGRA